MKTSCLLSLVCLCVLVQSVPALVKEIKSNTPNALFAAAVQSMTSHHRAKRCIPGGRLTYEERVEFLQSHNNYRRGVTPPASDMQFMVWHEELATMAQEWADRCVWEHGHYARDPEPFSWIGQNIYATTASTVSGSVAVTSWYNEVNDYSYTPNTCADGKVCGHYTQVVWKNSINLGCAIAECPFLSKVNFTDAYFVVCNYGPGGNIVGQWPYSEGVRCSECPSGTVCDNGLCAPSPKCGTKTCVNGGTLDGETCECHCVAGYYGVNCTYGDGEDYGGDYGDDGGDDGNDGGDDGNDGGDDGNDGGDDAEDGDNDTDDGDDGDYWFGVVWVRSAANVPKALSWLYVVVSAFLLQLVFQNN